MNNFYLRHSTLTCNLSKHRASKLIQSNRYLVIHKQLLAENLAYVDLRKFEETGKVEDKRRSGTLQLKKTTVDEQYLKVMSLVDKKQKKKK